MLLSSVSSGQVKKMFFPVTNNYIMKKKIILVLFQVFLLNIASIAQVNFSLPFAKCWELKVENIDPSLIASDNESLFIAFQDRVEALSKGGNILWNQSLNNEEIFKVFILGDSLIILSRNFQEKNTDSNYQFNFSKISIKSGLILQKKEKLILDVKSEVILKNRDLFFISEGQLMKLNIDNLQIQVKPLPNKIPTLNLNLTQDFIFTDSEGFLLYFPLNIEQNSEVLFKKIALPISQIKLLVPFLDGFIFVDKFGTLGLLNGKNQKVVWKQKLGGEINQIEQFQNSLFIVSNDNFVYKFIASNGKKVWKKKLLGRSQFSISINSQTDKIKLNILGIVNIGEKITNIIESENGKTINQIDLENEEYFIGKPYFFGDRVLLLTNNSILGYQTQQCKKADF